MTDYELMGDVPYSECPLAEYDQIGRERIPYQLHYQDVQRKLRALRENPWPAEVYQPRLMEYTKGHAPFFDYDFNNEMGDYLVPDQDGRMSYWFVGGRALQAYNQYGPHYYVNRVAFSHLLSRLTGGKYFTQGPISGQFFMKFLRDMLGEEEAQRFIRDREPYASSGALQTFFKKRYPSKWRWGKNQLPFPFHEIHLHEVERIKGSLMDTDTSNPEVNAERADYNYALVSGMDDQCITNPNNFWDYRLSDEYDEEFGPIHEEARRDVVRRNHELILWRGDDPTYERFVEQMCTRMEYPTWGTEYRTPPVVGDTFPALEELAKETYSYADVRLGNERQKELREEWDHLDSMVCYVESRILPPEENVGLYARIEGAVTLDSIERLGNDLEAWDDVLNGLGANDSREMEWDYSAEEIREEILKDKGFR